MNLRHPATLSELLTAFESLGLNCEFGLVQRRADAEPIGLLRMAGFGCAPEARLRALIAALEKRFEGLGAPGGIRLEFRGEFIAIESTYGLQYHTGVNDPLANTDELCARECRQLVFRRRKFLEDLAAGEKIWVWTSAAGTEPDEVLALLRVLRSFGPNRLVWVVEGDAAHAPGTAELLQPDLVKGYIERFNPLDDVSAIVAPPWFDMCDAAYRLFHPDWTANIRGEKEVSIISVADRIDTIERWEPIYAYPGLDLGFGCHEAAVAGEYVHRRNTVPLKNYRLLDARVDGASMIVSARGGRVHETDYLSLAPPADGAGRPLERLPDGFEYVMARSYGDYYHWLTQAVPAIHWSMRHLDPARMALLSGHLAPWEVEAIGLLGCGAVPRVAMDRSRLYAVPVLHYSEFQNGQSVYGVSFSAREAFRAMANAVPERDLGVADILYVARFDNGRLVVENEAEVIALMAREGVRIIVPGSMSVADQIAMFREARAVIGPHGPGLTNVVFCRPGTIFCEWHTDRFLNPCMARLAQAAMLDYWVDVFPGSPGELITPHLSPWSIDLTVAEARLRAIKAALHNRAPSRFLRPGSPVAAETPPTRLPERRPRDEPSGGGQSGGMFLDGMFKDWPATPGT